MPSEFLLGTYTPEDSGEALELERRCVQGTGLQLSFRRPTFHSRIEGFSEWTIFTAREQGRLAGVAGAAIKPVVFRGEPCRAALYLDLRVDPAARGRGVAQMLCEATRVWARERSTMAYTYVMAANKPAHRLLTALGGTDVGGYRYLVLPVRPPTEARRAAVLTSPEEVHRQLLATAGPFDFCPTPERHLSTRGHRGSWIATNGSQSAGCSAWSNEGIFAEVVESLPWPLRLLRAARSTVPGLDRWCPPIPGPAEELRSWYLYDWFGTGSRLAPQLLAAVMAAAHDLGIAYCYLIHREDEAGVTALRNGTPSLLSPIIPYRLILEPAATLHRIHVDVRDV